MKFELFKEVVLLKDIPEQGLKKGDVATIVEYHPAESSKDGYTLEVFNASGDRRRETGVAGPEMENRWMTGWN